MKSDEKQPEVIGAMLETHAGFYASGPDDDFEIGSYYTGAGGLFRKHAFAWERLGDPDAAPETPAASEKTKGEKRK
jgi:hypothetical protein